MLRRAGVAGSVAALVVAAGLSGCSAFGNDPKPSTRAVASARSDTPGGILKLMSLTPIATWDPQRIGDRSDAAFAGRVFQRTLTAYTPSTPTSPGRLVGDLATDTGSASEDLKTWSFTLRQGLLWQDGSAVTCEDVKYGISRAFAPDAVTGGSSDLVAVLAVGRTSSGASKFQGPGATGKEAAAGAADFAKAVTCEGQKLTLRLAAPVSDLAELVSLPAAGAFKKSQDSADGKSAGFTVFSNGPYQLKGTWNSKTGGTFVRNPSWQASSDVVRKAYPDEITYAVGVDSQTVAQDVLADTDAGRTAVALTPAPVAMRQQIETIAALKARSVNVSTGVVDHVIPNLKSDAMRNPQVRRALALATNRDAYVTSLGGRTAGSPTQSLIPASLPARHDNAAVTGSMAGDPAAAATLLADAGIKAPVRLRVAYRQGELADRAMMALARGWDEAGFSTELKPLGEDYFSEVSAPDAAKNYELLWSSWAPLWASGSTIFPALFDPRINLTDAGTGRDLGSFDSAPVTKAMDAASAIRSPAEREKAWGAIDATLQGEVAYIALAERRVTYIAGSAVRNLTGNELMGGSVDLATIAVAR